MKEFLLLSFLCIASFGFSQSLPIDFESDVTTENFVDFDGGIATVLDNPQKNGINTSDKVAQIVRDGGTMWAGSKILLDSKLDFEVNSTITMKVFTTLPVGTIMKIKLEGDGAMERNVPTTVSGEWETMSWDFTGAPMSYEWVVFMFDYGNIGDGTPSSTFLFDDVQQVFVGAQVDLPVDFEGEAVNYTTTDFGGNQSSLVNDPTINGNKVIKVIKTDEAATWAGTTIGTPAGFKTDIPLTLTDSKMSVKVWSPEAGTPVRLKVEDSNDPTHTCETQSNSTLDGGWEIITFDFATEAPGTAALETGLSMGWTYNMASIFFNFDIEGAVAGEKTYYFDDVKFGEQVLSTEIVEVQDISISPNPSSDVWRFVSETSVIEQVIIYDLFGNMVQEFNPFTNSLQVVNTGLNAGVYVAYISTENGISAKKIIKK